MAQSNKKAKGLLALLQPKLLILSCSLLPILSHASIANVDFSQCKTNLAERAKNEGFSNHITQTVISGISPVQRVITLDKKQPEFSQSFEQYIKARVTDYHVRVGKEKLKQHESLFDSLEIKYGIPRQYLVSFWGLETVYGKHKGTMSVLNALTTLACDERRSEFFTLELLNLFTLIEKRKVSIEQLQGSWAGAMGHMQFLPTAFLNYAVDGDNDGKVDIWQSEIDALTTAANYLNKIGWQEKERWGREVTLPKGFSFNGVAFDKYYPLSFFKELGIKKSNGQPLPDYDIQTELFLPSGIKGHAFLLYPNFNVIMKWNLSKNYALSVGLLANQLIGAKGLKLIPKGIKPTIPYRASDIKLLQEQLNFLGYDSGEPDGIWGPNSRQAIQTFQRKFSLVADGYPNQEVISKVKEIVTEGNKLN